MENYEKKYKEALDKVQRFYNNSVAITKKGLEDIFPELTESEDEKIRKAIINEISLLEKESVVEQMKAVYQSWIAWLEKQGEQEKLNTYIDKIASDTIYNDENGNPIDKDLMAFASKVAFSMIPAIKTESYHHINRGRISDAVIKGAQWKEEQLMSKAIVYNDKIYPTTYENEPTEFCLDGGEEVRLITESVNSGVLKQGDKVKVIIVKED